jgi:hypothetical protein
LSTNRCILHDTKMRRYVLKAILTIAFCSMLSSASSFVAEKISRPILRNSQLKRCISKFAKLNLVSDLNLNLSKNSREQSNFVSDTYDPAHSRPCGVAIDIKSCGEATEGSNQNGESELQLRDDKVDLLPQIYTRIQTQLFPQIPF